MHRRLRLGSERYIILSCHEAVEEGYTEVPEFQDRNAALAKLRRLAGDPMNMNILLDVDASGLPMSSASRDREFALGSLATKLARKQIKLAWRQVFEVGVDAQVKPEAAEPAEEEVSTRLAWIAVKVVDHKTGQPIPEVELEVTLPDDSVRKGRTNGAGELRVDGIPSGVCGVTCPVKGIRWARTLEFVTVGQRKQDNQPAPPPGESPRAAGAGKKKGPLRVVILKEHRLQDKETLDEVAAANELSFEDLTMFNWETTDQDEIKQILKEEDIVDAPPAPTDEDGASPELEPTPEHEAPLVGPPIPDHGNVELATGVPRVLPLRGQVRPTVVVPTPLRRSLETQRTHVIRVKDPAEQLAYLSFVLCDTGWNPLGSRPYRITDAGGALLFEGTTDAEGFLEHGPVEMAAYGLTVGNVKVEQWRTWTGPATIAGRAFGPLPPDRDEYDSAWAVDEPDAPPSPGAADDVGGDERGTSPTEVQFSVTAVWEDQRRFMQGVPGVIPVHGPPIVGAIIKSEEMYA